MQYTEDIVSPKYTDNTGAMHITMKRFRTNIKHKKKWTTKESF
jgi:hypothetical protein